jgi:hypothetical protein
MKGKDSFDTIALGDFPNDEAGTGTALPPSDHYPFKGLDPKLATLSNLVIDANRVSWTKVGNLILEMRLFNHVHWIHLSYLVSIFSLKLVT